MHLLILTQVYPPEAHPTAVMVRELGEYLVERGHQVTVAAGYPHHPHGRVFGGYERRLLHRETAAGVRVIRGWHATSSRAGFSARAIVMASQALGTALAALGSNRPDVVLNVGLPLVGPLLAAAVARRFGAPLVSLIYDLYPDIAIETGRLRNPALVRASREVEAATYKLSDRIVVLSQGFKRNLMGKGVPPEKIGVVPVWLDSDEIHPLPRENPWRAANAIPAQARVVLYAGTIGLVSGAHVVLEAAAALKGRPEILFLLVGEGRVKDALQVEALDRNLVNVRFLPFQPRAALPYVQATADVSLVTLAPGRGRTSVPSKVVGYFAAGRPVVASVDEDSDTADAVRHAGGVVVPPSDPDALARAICDLLDSTPEHREELGRASRRYFEGEYARSSVLERFQDLLETAANPGRARAGRSTLTSSSLVVRPMSRGDVPATVDVHLRAFPNFFLTFLGPEFLSLLYGQAVVGEIALVATVDDRLVGFVMGSSKVGGFYSRLLRTKWLAFARAATPAVIRKPSTALRVARAVLKPKEAVTPPDVATLMSLGVDPGVQRNGAGRRLVTAFLDEAARRGARRVTLTTDKYDNDKAQHFYTNLGFHVAREIVTPERRVLYEYERGVSAPQASD
jgi:colanic acid biosynthesis glycosyl transferase WcaI